MTCRFLQVSCLPWSCYARMSSTENQIDAWMCARGCSRWSKSRSRTHHLGTLYSGVDLLTVFRATSSSSVALRSIYKTSKKFTSKKKLVRKNQIFHENSVKVETKVLFTILPFVTLISRVFISWIFTYLFYVIFYNQTLTFRFLSENLFQFTLIFPIIPVSMIRSIQWKIVMKKFWKRAVVACRVGPIYTFPPAGFRVEAKNFQLWLKRPIWRCSMKKWNQSKRKIFKKILEWVPPTCSR